MRVFDWRRVWAVVFPTESTGAAGPPTPTPDPSEAARLTMTAVPPKDARFGMEWDIAARAVHRTAKDHGWWDDPADDSIERKLLLVVSEISEAYEEIRNRGIDDVTTIYYNSTKPGKPEGVAVELVDAVIRLQDMCVRWEIPFNRAYALKAQYNKSRPYRHGGKHA
jgi:hypothetical protein